MAHYHNGQIVNLSAEDEAAFEVGRAASNPTKERLKAQIDRDAERTRLTYITPGAGQAMAYQEKLAEARLVLDDEVAAAALTAEDAADLYPILMSEIGITGETLAAVATVVHGRYLAFKSIEGQINRKRLMAKAAVEAAETVDAAQAAAQVDWTLT
jgi:hypothetical protein